MTGASAPPPARDPARVVELRRAALERAGFDPGPARILADRLDLALPHALDLRRAGFPPEVVLAMLASCERPVF